MKRIKEALGKPEWGKLYVGSLPINMGPTEVGDTVTVKASHEIDFYIEVKEIKDEDLIGVINAIGPEPRVEWEGWNRGDEVIVADSLTTSIIRSNP